MTQNTTTVEKVDDGETPLLMQREDETEVARITKDGECVFYWDIIHQIADGWTPGTDDLMTCICKMLVEAKNVGNSM